MGMANETKVRTRRLAEDAYEKLRDLVCRREIAPGERLTEPYVCERLGMSRTPVREAINRLVAEGLLVSTPHCSVRPRVLGMRELLELLAVRKAFEVQGARLASARATPDALCELYELCDSMSAAHAAGNIPGRKKLDFRFHMRLMELSGNALLLKTYQDLHLLHLSMFAHRQADVNPEKADLDLVGDVHRPIVDALKTGDPGEAEKAIRASVRYAVDLYRS